MQIEVDTFVEEALVNLKESYRISVEAEKKLRLGLEMQFYLMNELKADRNNQFLRKQLGCTTKLLSNILLTCSPIIRISEDSRI